MAFKEMTCVYALGPLGGGGGPAGGSITGRANARVAPSDGSEDGAATGNFTIGGGGGVIGGVGKIGGAGATYDIGGGGGAGGSSRGSGTTDAGSTTARGSPIGGAVVLDIRDGISGVNHPVKPVPADSLPAIPAAGGGSSGCGFNGPNIAVKSPTFFRGGSIGCEDTEGVGDGLSPRNGP
jgi:hypothetical protein